MKIRYAEGRFGDMLVDRGVISREDAEDAVVEARRRDIRVGEALILAGKMSPAEVLENLSRFYGIPYVNKLSPDMIHKQYMSDWSEEFVRSSGIVFLDKKVLEETVIPEDLDLDGPPLNSSDIIVGLTTPERLDVVQRIERKYENIPLCFLLLPPEQFLRVVDGYYVSGGIGVDEGVFARQDLDDDGGSVREGLAKTTLKNILQYAINNNATDIHISPAVKSRGFLVRVRINGELQEYMRAPSYSRAQYEEITAYIKVFAGIPVDQKLTPQDGGWSEKMEGKVVDIRVATTPTAYNRAEKITLRLLNKSVGDSLEALYFTEGIIKKIDKCISNPYGLVLITGPTGSGKTTTIYSMLKRLNRETRKVYTVEDPVEYFLEGSTQIQINPIQGMTFPAILRSILRHDPDIVFVGEIRDDETASIALRLAMTGHLVLSTLHTNNATEAIPRLVAMGVPIYMLSGSVLGIGAQRLVKVLCPSCRKPYTPTDFEKEVLYLPEGSGIQYYRSGGCGRCRGTGTITRRAAMEFASFRDVPEWEDMFRDSGSGRSLRKVFIERYGMRTMYIDALRMMLEGTVSPETAVYSIRPDHMDVDVIKSGQWKELIKDGALLPPEAETAG